MVDVKNSVSKEEWDVRVDLAAFYRTIPYFGWDDLIFTHISARVPGTEDHFLINPYGFLFDEITASNLVKVDINGKIISETNNPINPAGFIIHSAIHEARSDAHCIVHLHSDDGVAVASLKDGLLPLAQTGMLVRNQIAYHDYEGPSLYLDERERLARSLGTKHIMILRNHGLMTVGKTVAAAFQRLYRLERACQVQIDAGAAGNLNVISDNLAAKSGVDTNAFSESVKGFGFGELEYAALMRKVDRIDASYAA